MRWLATAAVPLLLVAGCGGDAMGEPDGGGHELAGRTFLSESVAEDGSPVDLVGDTRISLEFAAGDELVGRAGCNILRSDVEVGADRLEVTGIEQTEIGCEPARHAQDEWLSEFLQRSPAWALDGDRLTLTAGGTELVLRDRRTADPDRALVGTRWIVDTIITGEVARSTVAGTEGTAWLVIEDDTFRASSGCRDIDGQVSVGEQQLRFHDTVQTDPACPPELVDVDDAMVTVLSGEVDYTIEADQLRLAHPDDVGLGLHADE